MKDLKSCPFCKGMGKTIFSTSKNKWRAECANRHVTVKCPVNMRTHYFDTESEAIDAWNHRADSTEIPEWLKIIIKIRISHLQESVDATDYDDNKYAWNFAIEELQDILGQHQEPLGNTEVLPRWLKEAVVGRMNLLRKIRVIDAQWHGNMQALEWFLSLRPPEEAEP